MAPNKQNLHGNNHHHLQQYQPPSQAIARTRQDLINTGKLFYTNEPDGGHQFKEGHEGGPETSRRHAPARRSSSSSGGITRSSDRRGGLTECCYSISNVVLIIATVAAIILLIRFLLDEPLSDYYEYLLSLRFYRQMIFVTVLMPFVLLIPLYNALKVLFSIGDTVSRRHNSATMKSYDKSEANARAHLKVKLAYQALIIVLVFLALVFVGPYVRSSTLESQLELELRRFMLQRYVKEFALQLMDRVQEQYECCDQMWYRANLDDRLPLSCFVPNTNFSLYFERTCSEALGTIIGTRLYLIAACLVVILVALACLVAADLSELFAKASGHYQVHRDSPSSTTILANRTSGSRSQSPNPSEDSSGVGERLLANAAEHQDGDNDCRSELSLGQRLKLDGSERNYPASSHQMAPHSADRATDKMITSGQSTNRSPRSAFNNGTASPANGQALRRAGERHVQDGTDDFGEDMLDDDEDELDNLTLRSQNSAVSSAINPSQEPTGAGEPIVLARAQYQSVRRERAQSPMFVSHKSADTDSSADEATSGANDQYRAKLVAVVSDSDKPIKSVLKKAASNSSNIDMHDGEPAGFHHGGSQSARTNQSGHCDLSSDEDNDYTERLRQTDSLLRQKQLQRAQQMRRSLLSVRFADDAE